MVLGPGAIHPRCLGVDVSHDGSRRGLEATVIGVTEIVPVPLVAEVKGATMNWYYLMRLATGLGAVALISVSGANADVIKWNELNVASVAYGKYHDHTMGTRMAAYGGNVFFSIWDDGTGVLQSFKSSPKVPGYDELCPGVERPAGRPIQAWS